MNIENIIKEIKKHFSLEALVFHVFGVEEIERFVPK